jgi:Lipopolysaccharide-assembly
LKNKQSTVNGQRSTVRCLILIAYCAVFLSTSSCGIYSFTGVSITAKNISITEFYNNTDLGPANLGQTFTNRLRDYMLQNTNLSIVSENGELQMDGIVAEFKISQVAPTVGSNPNDVTTAALTKLTITVKATYVNSADDSMSFKDRSFSFFENVDNDNPDAISEAVINRILDQIILDMFNASVANW